MQPISVFATWTTILPLHLKLKSSLKFPWTFSPWAQNMVSGVVFQATCITAQIFTSVNTEFIKLSYFLSTMLPWNTKPSCSHEFNCWYFINGIIHLFFCLVYLARCPHTRPCCSICIRLFFYYAWKTFPSRVYTFLFICSSTNRTHRLLPLFSWCFWHTEFWTQYLQFENCNISVMFNLIPWTVAPPDFLCPRISDWK